MEITKDLADLGARMVEYRGKNKISQDKLAEMCGLTQRTISVIESGKTNPKMSTVYRINVVIDGK